MYLRRETGQGFLAPDAVRDPVREQSPVAFRDDRAHASFQIVFHAAEVISMNKTILKTIAYVLNTVGLLIAILFIILIIRGI